MIIRKKMNGIALALFLLFFSKVAVCAAPYISEVGPVNIDGYVKIVGVDFGEGDISPTLWDDFESGTGTLSLTPKVGTWTHQDTKGTRTRYETSNPHSGTQCAFTPPREHWSDWGNFAVEGLENADKIYWSFWFRFNKGGSTGHQTKLIQLWGNGPSPKCDYAPGFYSGGAAGDWFTAYQVASSLDCSTGRKQHDYGFTPSEDTWHHMEVILERSTDGIADGTIVVNVDGRSTYDHRGDILTRMDGQDWSKAKFFYGFTNDSDDDGNHLGSFAIDDAYLNNSWSRVEIGNKQKYEDCTQREIQIPANWQESDISESNDSIDIIINRGSMPNGSVYLFVIDSDGNVSDQNTDTPGSQGYEIIFEQSDNNYDINGDNLVNIIDVTICVNIILGTVSGNADVNSDGQTNVQDVIAIVNEISAT